MCWKGSKCVCQVRLWLFRRWGKVRDGRECWSALMHHPTCTPISTQVISHSVLLAKAQHNIPTPNTTLPNHPSYLQLPLLVFQSSVIVTTTPWHTQFYAHYDIISLLLSISSPSSKVSSNPCLLPFAPRYPKTVLSLHICPSRISPARPTIR